MTQHGLPSHSQPWPPDKRYDKQLLANGDRRNVADKYRYWTIEAIRDDLRESSAGCEIAVENLERDFNMGTIVRNANAFNVSKLHIIGRRQWNKRGAMMTDVYLQLEYHETVADFMRATLDKIHVAIDNTEGAVALHKVVLPRNAVLIFGSEGRGISDELNRECSIRVEIEQFGSTRSINVGVASGILMYKWAEQHTLSKI